ncbi:hyaluronate lyase N-terminal domain-containing protein [Paenibacillus cymbidii]|uniref:hyaluronate lyase N-terminal domain-containing protein n=1 Tax=Paenibacillus cymbidii TaxID=1639034 RepID=UPI001081E79E|nr:phage tail protein [Paenibacillus cymbidii]
MARKVLIQIRRGAEAGIGTLAVAELGYCTDTQKLYIGSAGGNVLLVAATSVGDMLKGIYDTDNDGIVDAAESVAWTGVVGRPGAATQAEAEAGASSAPYMTPLRTAQAIAAMAMPKGPFSWANLHGSYTWGQLKGG